jgi:hypothetical protein
MQEMRAVWNARCWKTRPMTVNEGVPTSPSGTLRVLCEKRMPAGGSRAWKEPEL